MSVWKGVKEVCQKFTENIEQKRDRRLNSDSMERSEWKQQTVVFTSAGAEFFLPSCGASTGTSPLTHTRTHSLSTGMSPLTHTHTHTHTLSLSLSFAEILLEIKRTIRYRRKEFRDYFWIQWCSLRDTQVYAVYPLQKVKNLRIPT